MVRTNINQLKIYLLFILATTQLACNDQNYKLHSENINGPVENFIEITLLTSGENNELDSQEIELFSIKHFNQNNELMKDERFDNEALISGPAKLTSVHDYIYGKEDKLLEIKSLSDGDSLSASHTYNYLDPYTVLERSKDAKGNLEKYVVLEFKEGKRDSVKTFSKDSTLISITHFNYFNKDSLEIIEKDISGKINYRNLRSFNQNRHVNYEKITYFEDLDTTSYEFYFEYSYDDNENWTRRDAYTSGSLSSSTFRFYKYSDGGNTKIPSGVWNVLGNNRWLEITEDGKFYVGRRDKISEQGNYEIKSDEHTIRLFPKEEDSDARILNFRANRDFLLIRYLDGRIQVILENKNRS